MAEKPDKTDTEERRKKGRSIIDKMNDGFSEAEDKMVEDIEKEEIGDLKEDTSETRLKENAVYYCQKSKGLKIVCDPAVQIKSSVTGKITKKKAGTYIKFENGRFVAKTEEDVAILDQYMKMFPGEIITVSDQQRRVADLSRAIADGDVDLDELEKVTKKGKKKKGRQGASGGK
jgi:hypothetical protein